MKIYIGIDSHGEQHVIASGNTHSEAYAAARSKAIGYLVDHIDADDLDQWTFKEKT